MSVHAYTVTLTCTPSQVAPPLYIMQTPPASVERTYVIFPSFFNLSCIAGTLILRKEEGNYQMIEMGGGTEAFPDLGSHCQLADCHQLDFLPFACNACQKVFCLEHRSYKSHDCPKSDDSSRKVVVCEICSAAIETTGRSGEDEKKILEKHEISGECDPKKKKKPTCPVRRCKEVLTFSNTMSCKICHIKFCLKHRFSADHECEQLRLSSPSAANNKFLVALAARSAKDCGKSIPTHHSPPSVKAC